MGGEAPPPWAPGRARSPRLQPAAPGCLPLFCRAWRAAPSALRGLQRSLAAAAGAGSSPLSGRA
eukprot:5385610-Lingulodinium_polyedra.AAC.1